jgi:flavin reductase (DIM6/NTAB) family NADH-FMN oxidoreductase RutF
LLAQEDTGRMVDRGDLPPDPEPVEPADGQLGVDGQISVEDFKRAAGSFITGVTVVTTRAPDGKLMGFTANSFTSVSLDPPLVLICLHRNAPSLHAFRSGGGFSVNVLAADQEWVSRHFSRPSEDKFASVAYRLGTTGAPQIEGCIAHMDCSLEVSYDGGDHVILLGRVRSVATGDGSPLIFHRSRYLRAV